MVKNYFQADYEHDLDCGCCMYDNLSRDFSFDKLISVVAVAAKIVKDRESKNKLEILSKSEQI